MVRRLTIPEFHAELKAQGVSGTTHLAFKCPICGTIQSAHDLIQAGAGPDLRAVEKYLGFSCVGRFTNAGPHKKGGNALGNGCDWTLGGLFQVHELEVIDGEGKAHPRFELATPEEAQRHEQAARAMSGDIA